MCFISFPVCIFWGYHALFFLQIERLCDRAQSSTLLDDRRDSIRALKSLSRVSIQSTKHVPSEPEFVNYQFDCLSFW